MGRCFKIDKNRLLRVHQNRMVEKKAERHDVYIGAGSNMGDRFLNCRNGIDTLIKSGNSVLVKKSKIYKTEPVDYLDQNRFINFVVKIETDLDPFVLLKKLKDTEREIGRKDNSIRFGPRILDLDIIFYDDLVVNTSSLVIPHPRMHKRRFVLQPVCDINPEKVHPVFEKTVKSLLNCLNKDGQGVFEY